GFESFQIEDSDGVGATVAYEAAAQFWRNRDAVNALSIRDVSDDSMRVCIENNDVRGMRQVQAAGIRIDEQIVPSPFAGNGDRTRDFIARCSGSVHEPGVSSE